MSETAGFKNGKRFTVTTPIPAPEIKSLAKAMEKQNKKPSTDVAYFMRNMGFDRLAANYSVVLKEYLGLNTPSAVLRASVISDTFGNGKVEVSKAIEQALRAADSNKLSTINFKVKLPFAEQGWTKWDYVKDINDKMPELIPELWHNSYFCWERNNGKPCGACTPDRKKQEAFERVFGKQGLLELLEKRKPRHYLFG